MKHTLLNRYFSYVYILAILTIYLPLSVASQHFRPYAIRYAVKDGIPSSECYSVFQDTQKRLWIGTDKGVCYYNGQTFVTITPKHGLPDAVVFGFFEDSKKRIWFRTHDHGVCYLEKDRIVVPPFNKVLLQSLARNLLVGLYVSSDDSVYLSDNVNRLHVAQLNDTGVYTLQTQGTVIRTFGNTALAYGTSKKGEVGVLYDGHYQEKIETTKLRKEPFFRACKLYQGDWLIYNNNHLYIKQKGKPRLEQIPHISGRLIALFEDKDEGVWVGMSNKGVYYYKHGLKQPPVHFMNHLSVSDVTEDTEGNIWLTTLESGVFFIPDKDVENLDIPGQGFNMITNLGGKLMATTRNAEIMILNSRGVQQRIPYPKQLGLYQNIYGLHVYDSSHVLLVGSNTLKLNTRYRRYDPVVNRFFYRGIKASKNGEELYLYNYTYVLRYNKKLNRHDTLFRHAVRMLDLAVDENNNLWMATNDGLFWYAQHIHKLQKLNVGALNQLRINAIVSVGNRLILGTEGSGIYVWNTINKQLITINEQSGMTSNYCKSIYAKNGEVWVATNRGVTLIEMDNDYSSVKRLHQINKYDGLPCNEINAVYVQDNEVWIASNEALTKMKRKPVYSNKSAPELHLEYVKVNNHMFKEDSMPPVFNSDDGAIELAFMGISLKSQGDLKYMYRLNGTKDSWHYTSQPRINYASLSPGLYQVELYALNNDLLKSDALIVKFEVETPVWRTWQFVLTVGFMILFIILWLFRVTVRRVKKREMMKNFYANKVLEYEMRALRSQMNAHFIFNAISSIQQFILAHEVNAANKYLIRFSRLIRGVLEHSRSSLINLSSEMQTLQWYVDIENLRLDNRLNFTMRATDGLNPEYCKIPPMLIQPFVENAIWHGLHPKPGVCMLHVLFRQEGNYLICSIDDNGIGRKKSAQLQDANKENRSWGITLTQNRIEAIEKIYHLKLSFEIIDKVDVNNEPVGTTVIITMPYLTDNL